MGIKFGFTLIDLIVSIAIFGLITTAVMVNFRAGQRNDTVRQSANIASSFLRRAQTMTLSGAVLPDGTFPQGGYGVRFDTEDTDTLVLFADKDGNYLYEESEQIETENLAGDAYFNSSGNLDVVFSSPDADAYFNGLSSEASKQITFAASSADVTQNVVIYRVSGQIKVE